MPSTAGIVASGSAQLDQWLRANLIAFDERRSSPLTNLGTLGAAGDAVATGTRRLVNNETGAVVWVSGVSGNGLSTTALTMTGATSLQVDFDITPDALTTGAIKQLVGQFSGSAGNWGWQLYATTTSMGFFFSADGTATTGNPTCAYSTFGFGAGRIRGRVIWRANNGSGNWDVRWYTLTAEGAATLVETDTGSGTSSIFNSTQAVEIGGRVGFVTDNFPMVVHSVNISVDGVLQRGIDPSVLTDEGASSFTATTGQTVWINRTTGSTGYKTEIVLPGSGSRLFNGTTDWLEVANNAALNFGASDSFTAWAFARQAGTFAGSQVLISKTTNLSSLPGYALYLNSVDTWAHLYGGAISTSRKASGNPGGLTLHATVRNVGLDRISAYGSNGFRDDTDLTTASLTTTDPVRFGRLSGAGTGLLVGRMYAWGIYAGALTAAQLAALRDALLVPERAAA